MDVLAIGEKIRELRKEMGYSQKELAKDICTQAQISKIEQGITYPLASTLYHISQRLGVDVNYFFDIGTTPRLDYVQEVTRQLKYERRKSRYDQIKQIVETEEKNPLFSTNKKHMQLLLWHKGIYIYHVHHDFKRAVEHLDQAILLTFNKVWSEREIEISLSKGIFHYEENLVKEALSIFLAAEKHLGNVIYLQDDTIKARLLYDIAKALSKLGQYDQSMDYCQKAIDWAIEKDNLYLFGELYYHIGYNYELKHDFVLAKRYMEKSLLFFDLLKDDRYISFIKTKISKWL
ncbi:helix-turn-helix domain-containing protein [Bacillus sp. 03113]|uniref:helix-turn-helix domain-containing protein n=1 Tax=Bacillus sp. 03113 TaxID=2578211 RepID=UPI0011429016|nr:helix-turn-helix domain-containing protein [Bacillus sp. 03113]